MMDVGFHCAETPSLNQNYRAKEKTSSTLTRRKKRRLHGDKKKAERKETSVLRRKYMKGKRHKRKKETATGIGENEVLTTMRRRSCRKGRERESEGRKDRREEN